MNQMLIGELRRKTHEAMINCETKKKYDELSNELWVLDGILVHHLEHDLLQRIKNKYQRLGLVLKHYDLPELYQAP